MKSYTRKYDQPKQCDFCVHRCGKIQDPNRRDYGDAYCVVHKASCFDFLDHWDECPDFKEKYYIPGPRGPVYAPTDACLDRFFEVK